MATAAQFSILAVEAITARYAAEDIVREPRQPSLEALIDRIVAGDTRAWAKMMSSEHRRVYEICYRFTGNATGAEDLVQEVFLKIYGALPSFDPSKGSARTWITILTRNLLIDHIRRSRSGPTQSEMHAPPFEAQASSTADAAAPPSPSKLVDLVKEALAKISPDLREAVLLRDLEQMNEQEISNRLGVSKKVVRSRIHRGRLVLGELLQKDTAGSEAEAAREDARSEVFRRAVQVIGNESEAMRWMGTPVRALDYATPVSLLHDAKGREAVQLVLGRLEHGVL